MFHVLTYGQGNMPAFSPALSTEDRWSVILHVRLLQGPYAPSPVRDAGPRKLPRCSGRTVRPATEKTVPAATVRKILPLIPDFTSLAWQMSQTEMAIVNQIDYGSHPLMPAFRYKLPQEQILGLAVYVRSFAAHRPAGQPTVAATSHLTAKNVYGTFCFACHDTNGKGNPTIRSSMPDLPDFTAAAWQKSRTDADLAHSILEGKGKFMLPMKDKLGTVDIKEMVALVRGFEGGKQVVPLEAPKAFGPPPQVVDRHRRRSLLLPSRVDDRSAKTWLGAASRIVGRNGRPNSHWGEHLSTILHGLPRAGRHRIDHAASMPPIPNFTSESFHKEHSNAQILVSILDGKGTLMPANRGRVTEQQAGDLVAYVRAFGPPSYAVQTSARASDPEFEKKYRQLEEQWNELQKELEKIKRQKSP